MASTFLLPAKSAPIVAVLRRGPSKWWHVMRWNTETNEVEHGSWFYGILDPWQSELSPDGRFLAYFAYGLLPPYARWTGICELPWLRTIVHWIWEPGRRWGDGSGGRWLANDEFLLPITFDEEHFGPVAFGVQWGHQLPFKVVRGPEEKWDDLMIRLGWESLQSEGLPAWKSRPSLIHPQLIAYRPQKVVGHLLLQYRLEGCGLQFGREVQNAAWDCLGNLLIGEANRIRRLTLDDLLSGQAGFQLDLSHLHPPRMEDRLAAEAKLKATESPSEKIDL